MASGRRRASIASIDCGSVRRLRVTRLRLHLKTLRRHRSLMAGLIRTIFGGDNQTTSACKRHEFCGSSCEIFISLCPKFSSIAGLPTIAGTTFLAPSKRYIRRMAQGIFMKFGKDAQSTSVHISAKCYRNLATRLQTRTDVREKSIQTTRVELRFFDAKFKRLNRFDSNLVGRLGRSLPSRTTNFSRTRSPVRPPRHAHLSRDVDRRSSRYPPCIHCRSATADDIDATFWELRVRRTGNVPDEFHATAANRSNSTAV
jgi:hypothetical protein